MTDVERRYAVATFAIVFGGVLALVSLGVTVWLATAAVNGDLTIGAVGVALLLTWAAWGWLLTSVPVRIEVMNTDEILVYAALRRWTCKADELTAFVIRGESFDSTATLHTNTFAVTLRSPPADGYEALASELKRRNPSLAVFN